MTRLLFLPTLLLLPCLSYAADGGLSHECGDRAPAVAPARDAYVILIGYPEAPELRPLTKVGSDLAAMHQFFSAVRPVRTFVHAPDDEYLSKLTKGEVLTPSWPAVVDTIQTVRQAARGGDPDIYVYLTAHGRRHPGQVDYTTTLYLQAADGHNGSVGSTELNAQLLEPLSEVGRVHLIVDACNSFYIVRARGEGEGESEAESEENSDDPQDEVLKPRVMSTNRTTRIPDERPLSERFAERLPRVGVSLATNGGHATFEHPELGGLFSLALRIAASGHADLDGDDRVTYGELHIMLHWILASLRHDLEDTVLRSQLASPFVAGPAGVADEVFIDYRSAATNRICFTPDESGRFVISNEAGQIYTIANIGPESDGARPTTVHLPGGHTFVVRGSRGASAAKTWRLADGSGRFVDRREESQPLYAHRASTLRSTDFFKNPPPETLPEPPKDPALHAAPGRYAAVALDLLYDTYPSPDRSGVTSGLGAAVSAHWGRRAWLGAVRLGYRQSQREETLTRPAFTAHQIEAAVGGHFTTFEYGSLQLGPELRVGGGLTIQEDHSAGDLLASSRYEALVGVQGALGADPLGRRGALRLGVHTGPSVRVVEEKERDLLLAWLVQFSVGYEWEFSLD